MSVIIHNCQVILTGNNNEQLAMKLSFTTVTFLVVNYKIKPDLRSKSQFEFNLIIEISYCGD